LPNGDQFEEPVADDAPTKVEVNSDCGCLTTPIKVEPKDDGMQPAAVSVCPRVNIVDFESAAPSQTTDEGAKSDSTGDKVDADMKCEEKPACTSPEKVESETKVAE
jgi:hypothetical protein